MSHARVKQKGKQSNGRAPSTEQKSARKHGSSVATNKAGFHPAWPLHRLKSFVQTKLTVGPADDHFEREADLVADRAASGREAPSITALGPGNRAQRQEDETVQPQSEEDEPVQRQTTEEEPVQRQQAEDDSVQRQSIEEEPVQRQAAEEEQVQRKENGRPRMTAGTAATIRHPGHGKPLAPLVRQRIEPQVGADLKHVRVHTGSGPGKATANLNARAFTHGSDIFLSRTPSSQDVRLMAHEATHVVQQGAATVRRRPGRGASTPDVQRLPDFIMEELNDYARQIPGYTLFTVIIGYNPLLGERVDRNAINLLQGFMGLVPFGTFIFDKLNELGIIHDAFTWVEGELSRLDLSLERIERTIEEAWDDVRLLEGFEYNLNVVRRHFSRLYDDIVSFVESLVNRIIELIKEAVISAAEGLLAENRAWDLIKKIIKYDPLRDEPVEATSVEILEDFLMLIGKEQELEQMRERGTLQETADWLDTQFAIFMGLLAQLRSLITVAWDAIQPENLPNLMSNLETLATQAFSFLQQVWDFALTVALKVLELIKKALLDWLSSFAHEVPGFHLITVLIERNPFTGEAVPRTAENLIRGFITLIPGGNAIYDQMYETGVVPQAASRIEGAIAELGISWEFVVGIFTGIWDSLSIEDLIDPIGAFMRIRNQFGEPISRLFTFIRIVIEELFKLILTLMNFPVDIVTSIITNALQAFEDIRNDPIGFFLNMLRAVKEGFTSFFDNILTHLIGGLAAWLFRGLRDAGIEPPTDLSLESILDLVLQVLGISMERIWEKVAERIGQENVDRIRGAIDRLVGIWNFVRDVQERGVVAIWEYIESQISNLWNMILEKAQEWIMERIINRAIQWLLSMLDPTGIMAVVNSFMAFFRAVQSAIEYMRDILEIIDDYVSTIAAVARGDVQPGAEKLEQGLANAIPIAIGFLANQFGLGNIAEKVQEIIAGIRAFVDRALDWLLDQAERALQGLMRMLGFGGGEDGDEAEEEPVDPTDHRAIADRVQQQLQAIEVTGDYPTVKTQMEERALQLEQQYNAMLESGIGLRVRFNEAESDREDNDVDFTVIIAPNTVQQSGSKSLGPPPVTTLHSRPSGGKANKVEVKPLAQDAPSKGSKSTTARIPGASDIVRLNQGLSGRSLNWAKLHLIHYSLGGPNRGWNLIPGSIGANNNMSDWAENPAIRMLNSRPGMVMWYQTTVQSYHSAPFDTFAESIQVEYGEYDHINDDIKTTITPSPITSDDPNNQVAGGVISANINTDGRRRLSEIGGIPDELARAISTARAGVPFSSLRDLENRLLGEGGAGPEEVDVVKDLVRYGIFVGIPTVRR